ncbi:gas vesicle protein [Oikeobacillus pervagus]|uniref:Gas vesicle protein n=1 Tax=Oikeobacillus pervagus TaxID=1325931 RepID=A0AAJ1T1N7_9BACI|nr:YtxH domain-containing protein [Oikeobacillus pervagus]MDQ0215036.1 gas vesicle protein [Oikeobacillus pervagus]
MANENKKVKTNDENMNTKDFLIGALVGGIIGATTALFLAPKSGRELRDNLNGQAINLKEKATSWTETAKERGCEMASIAKEKTGAISKTVQDQSNDWISKVKTLKKSTKNEVDEINDSTTEDWTIKLDEAKKAFDETEKAYQQ